MGGVQTVFHAATLHKPHVATHSKEEFIEANLTGTLVLLEAAISARIEAFVYTSTTSAFGDALRPGPEEPAAWITEEVPSKPRNIYGVTKEAAEALCELFARREGLPVVVLRTSRFFPEEDDDREVRALYPDDDNLKVNELLYRRADLADIVDAHRLAAARAPELGFGRYIISATTPFHRDQVAALRTALPEAVRALYPEYETVYAARGWRLFPGIDRVYDNTAARRDLGWTPRYDFAHALSCLRADRSFRSELAHVIGAKGYHDTIFEDGPYPV